ncbi:hypothetical protein [Cellulomonas iranensis]|uniref:hypothetical protein n=1 Tax=Cellulomonas iranensis TaxID=76862 RepID=UPI001177880C|nr:hypothetical protein [Cellulomonas iranensis]UCN14591.1 hypothetical protein LFM56_17305 [Cellulomonas iranensis]
MTGRLRHFLVGVRNDDKNLLLGTFNAASVRRAPGSKKSKGAFGPWWRLECIVSAISKQGEQ